MKIIAQGVAVQYDVTDPTEASRIYRNDMQNAVIGVVTRATDHERAHTALKQLAECAAELDQARAALRQIAAIAGNLSDEQVQRVGGANDARRWTLAVVHARQIACVALGTASSPG